MAYNSMYQDVSFKVKTKRFIGQCWRVLKITKKPDRTEYKMLVKVSSLGIAVIGIIGFVLFMIKAVFAPF